MKRTILTALVVALAVLAAGAVEAKQNSVAGTWTMTIEHLPLRLVLTQKKQAIGGTLDYPHGAPLQLKGAFARNALTFSGDTSGENFTVHIDATGSLKTNGTFEGTLKAHFVDFDESHKVVREFNQDIAWTAARGGMARSLHP